MTRSRPRVALATCRELPDLDADDRPLTGLLAERGVDAGPAIWDDPGVAWDAFDLVVIRNTWDYTRRRDDFLDWAARVPRLANPADVLVWNTDKRYLAHLAAAGVAVVPTRFVAPGAAPADAGSPLSGLEGRVVVKPSVGAGSVDAGAFDLSAGAGRRDAAAHLADLLARGATALVQPYVESVDAHGEVGVVFVGGGPSHAFVKGAMLGGGRPGTPFADSAGGETGGPVDPSVLFHVESVSAHTAADVELAAAARAMAAVPGGPDRLLYGRVDLVRSGTLEGGGLLVLEMELTEPSLYLGLAPGAAERLADVVARAVAAAG